MRLKVGKRKIVAIIKVNQKIKNSRRILDNIIAEIEGVVFKEIY